MDSRLSARGLSALVGIWRTSDPAYEALADAIRVLCLDNRVAPRTALPAERELAASLRVSRTTVAAAYRSLRSSGHIQSTRGSGSVTQPLGRDDNARTTTDPASIDLQQASLPAWPGLAGILTEAAESAATLVSRSGYDIIGTHALRSAIAERYTMQGVTTLPEQIMVTSGAQSAIHLLATLLVGRGDRVLIETPTYPHAAEAFRRAGGRLVGVPVTTDDGWDLDRATQAFARTVPAVAYLMPDFQNPTGRTMTPHERTAVASAAAGAGTIVIVDETTADLDIDRTHTPKPFGSEPDSNPDHVVRIGSLGKSVWGGLRVGWIRADVSLIRRLVAARSAHDLGTPDFEQAVAARLVPRMPEILPQRAHLLRLGREAATRALVEHFPRWRVPLIDGGLALWVQLDAPLSAALVLDVRSRGLLISSGPRFAVDGGHDGRLRIPITAPPDVLAQAVRILADGWARVTSGSMTVGVDAMDAVV